MKFVIGGFILGTIGFLVIDIFKLELFWCYWIGVFVGSIYTAIAKPME